MKFPFSFEQLELLPVLLSARLQDLSVLFHLQMMHFHIPILYLLLKIKIA